MQKSKTENNLNEKQQRFKYSMAFEFAMREILGDKAYHSAASAGNPVSIKKICKKALDKIKERIDNIVTMDERLRAMLFSEISNLEKEISKINKENNDWEIISILFRIVARLLGYDWVSGKVCREVVYYRTREQEYRDFLNDNVSSEIRRKKYETLWKESEDVYIQRYKEILRLKEEGFHSNQIARIMNITEYAVNQLLKNDLSTKVIKLLNKGLNEEEIAKQLNIPLFTVVSLKSNAWLKARGSSFIKRKLRKEI